jgi:hypothetical protein
MKLRKVTIGLVTGAVLAGGLSVSIAESASAATGGVNVGGWCTSPARGILGGVSTGARATDPHNAYSWECTTKNWLGQTTRQSGVDMNAACAWTYPGHPGSARLGSPQNAYSWYCVY